jgi:hypothetical protein
MIAGDACGRRERGVRRRGRAAEIENLVNRAARQLV